jgi:hypothetical protein
LLQLFEIDYVSFAYRARYGVQLEKGVFEKRTADFLWMMIFGAFSLLVSYSFFYPFRSALANTKRQLLSLYTIVYFLNQVVSAIPLFEFAFLGIPMVSMLLYVWSREYPNSQINMYGLVQLRVCNFTVLLSALSIFFFCGEVHCPSSCCPNDAVTFVGLPVYVQFVDDTLLFAVFLSSMGYAWIGCDIWITVTAWASGYHGWTSILLPVSVAPASHWKELSQDSKMGVSFYTVLRK